MEHHHLGHERTYTTNTGESWDGNGTLMGYDENCTKKMDIAVLPNIKTKKKNYRTPISTHNSRLTNTKQ